MTTMNFILQGRDQLSRVLDRAGDSAMRLSRRLDDVSGDGGKALDGLKKTALSLAPAIIPAAAAMAPLVASTAAAGVAVAAYGAALGPQIAAMGEASQAEKKYTDAVDKSGAGSKEAVAAHEEYRQTMAKLPPATQRAAAALSVLKDEYKGWSDGLAKDTMGPVVKGMAIFGGLLPKLTPMVKGTSSELNRMMTILAGGMQSPGMDRLIKQFSEFSTSVLARVNSGLVRFIQSLDSGKVGGGLSEFMDYARANGPMVGDTLKNLAQALTRILVAASETGVGLLTVVNAFSKLVASVPTELISLLMQAAFAMKAISLASAGMALVGAGFASATPHVVGFARAARFGGVASAIQGVAQSMSLLQKSTVVLAVLAGVALAIGALASKAKGAPPDVDKLATSLKNLGAAGKFTGELKATFGDMDGFVAKVQKMRTESDALDKSREWTGLTGLGPIAEKAAKKVDELARGTKSLSASKEDFAAFDKSFASLASSGHADLAAAQFKKFEAALRGAGMSTKEIAAVFPEYKAAVASVKAEQELAARAMGLFGSQAQAVQAKLAAQKQSMDGLRQSLFALNDAYLMARGGVRGMEAAIDAASAAIKANGRTLDNNTEKGRANNEALDNLASSTMRAAAAVFENTGSWSQSNKVLDRGRGKLIESAMAMGLTKEKAAALAGQILRTPDKTARLKGNMQDLQSKLNHAKNQLARVPDSRKASVRARIDQLTAAIASARRQLNNIDGKTSHTYVITHLQARKEGSHGTQLGYAQGGLVGFPGGGPVRGPGTGTSDSILARVSNGEFVHQTKAVDKYGLPFMEAINEGRLALAKSAPQPRMAATRPAAAGRSGGGSGPIVIHVHVNGTVMDETAVAMRIQKSLLSLKRDKGGALLGIA